MSRWGTRRGDGLARNQSPYSHPDGPLEPFNHRTRVRQMISVAMKARYRRDAQLRLYQHEVLKESPNGRGE
jgi:hypothetical protein